jgi:hypothetical protein
MVEYLIKVTLTLILSSIAWLLAYPLAALSALLGWRNLPWWLMPLGQYDDDLDGSRDPGWRDPINNYLLLPDKGWRKVYNRAAWIRRNPAQYADYWLLGIPIWNDYKLRLVGDPDISDKPFRPGKVYKEVINYDGRTAFFFRWIFKWPLLKGKCCDIKLGYAVWDSVRPRSMAKLVFTPISFTTIKD